MTSSDKGVTVTQGDRLLVADILDEVSNQLDHVGIGQVADLIRDGEYDQHECVNIAIRHRQSAQADAVEIVREAVEALAPFAKLGEMANFAFAPALFADHQSLKDLPWSEDGKPVTATFGDVRRALQVYATLTDFHARGRG